MSVFEMPVSEVGANSRFQSPFTSDGYFIKFYYLLVLPRNLPFFSVFKNLVLGKFSLKLKIVNVG